MNDNLYFAYGSNLNKADWERFVGPERNPNAIHKVEVAYLPDFELVFDRRSKTRSGGVLNLKPRIGQLVAGVLFKVSADGWAMLDEKEGHPGAYQRFDTVALRPDGTEVRVTTYKVPDERRQGFVAPAQAYVEIVRAGLQAHGLESVMLDAAAKGETLAHSVNSVFVYGTLMRGESRFGALANHGLECVLMAEAPGRLADLGAYPGLLAPAAPDQWVEGEFIRLGDIGGALTQLDGIEGFRGYGRPGSLYRRALVDVGVGDGRVRRAWTYFYAGGHAGVTTIPSGSWRASRGRRDAFVERLVASYAEGDERGLTAALIERDTWRRGSDPAPAESVRPLADAVRDGEISERQLAMTTQRWTVVPPPPGE